MNTLQPTHTMKDNGAIRNEDDKLVAIYDKHDKMIHIDGFEFPLPCADEQQAMDIVAEVF